MKLPGFSAEASLTHGVAPFPGNGAGRVSSRGGVTPAASLDSRPGVSPAIKYPCHQVCMGDGVCIVVCGVIDYV